MSIENQLLREAYKLTRGEIIDLISPESSNSADHDIWFANRILEAVAIRLEAALTQPAQPASQEQAQQPSGIKSDFGPWSVSMDGQYIDSDDFEHDVKLIVRGDFRDDVQRRLYACDIAKRLSQQPSGGDAVAEPGTVYVDVSGFTGTGKSAVAGEIEIAMRAIGLQVEWVDGQAEKNMTGADWAHALEMYKPRVVIRERNIPLTIATPKPEQMTEHQRGSLVMEHLGLPALMGDKMSPLDAFTLGIEATERHYGITKGEA